MIEVAIASMREALAANGEEAPEGSLETRTTEPIPDAKTLAADVEARTSSAGTGDRRAVGPIPT